MRRLVVLAVLLGLMSLLQTLQVGTTTEFQALSLATFGFVLLAAYTLGQVAAGIQLPKITGYIVTGLVFGPQVFNVFSSGVESDLRVINDLAIGLIALSAGAEMHLSGLKKIARSLFWIVLIKGLLILALVTGTVIVLAPYLPFLAGQPFGLVASVGMILGVLAIGTSPAATIAVISETGAKGRLADTTLGVAVAKDIVMVVLLALGVALARTFSPDGHGFEAEILVDLAFELGLSLAAGAVLGGVIIAYIRYLGAELWLFVVGVVFAMTAIAHEFHLEALLVFIVAGFVVQNASSLGHEFVHLVERVALPVYVVFFSVAGAGLDLRALRSVLLIALALVAVRLLGIYVGTAVATRLAGEPEPIRRNAWLAFVAQAGVVIGLSIIVENNLPGLGSEIRTLVMGTVAIHLLLGPILFKVALSRAGEIESSEAEVPTAEVAGPDEGAELPAELAEPADELEARIRKAIEPLVTAGVEGPISLAEELRSWPAAPNRDELEARVADYSARDMSIGLQRLWSEAHHAALEAPRKVSVPLEESWYQPDDDDSLAEAWLKRTRRMRRGLRRLTGDDPVLRRTVPVRDLALYHLDGALVQDLEPVVARLAAQPALALRSSLEASEAQASPDRGQERLFGADHARAAVDDALEARFRTLRSELARAGTAALPDRRRRPSHLHERAGRARSRTTEAVKAWCDYAQAVVGHRRRSTASEDFRDNLREEAGTFLARLDAHYDDVVLQPILRGRAVIQAAAERVDALDGADSERIEVELLEISEALSQGLRRQSLAGLRRGIDAHPIQRELNEFDRKVEVRLEALPESFRVVDPKRLPRVDESVRGYPDPAEHEFRLIATGAVERTLGPALAAARTRTQEILLEAEEAVAELRANIERRFDAAVDAVIEEGREASARRDTGRELRRSLEIAGSALDVAASALSELEADVREVGDEIDTTITGDLDALVERLEGQLSSARPLAARLQAERARVELQGSVLLRLLGTRVRRRIRDLRERLGLEDDDEDEDRPPLRPAGPAGSDRAVLFGILFDDTTLAGKIFDGALILTILASILVLMLESVVPFRAAHGTTLIVLEWLFTLLFTAEYAARLWAVHRPARYAFSFFGIIDFLAVIPTYLGLLLPGGKYLMVVRVLRVARAFRVLKLARYAGEAKVLTDALKASRYKITVFLVYVLSVAVVMGSVMYLIEGPEAGFTSIPRGVYWSIVTLTTVGFGDITPQSPLGQALSAILMVLGYGIIAVPTGIVTAQIATMPARGQPVATCEKCGHVEHDESAVYCQICGTKFPL